MKYKKDKGMAIIAVLTLVIILIVLTTALVAMSKEHLFTTSKYYEKSVAQNLAEAAIYEAILKLKTTSTWGDPPGPTEYLLMRAGNQDVTAIGAGTKTANSVIPYDVKGAYFITFDPGAGVPYSTNNLSGGGTIQGWRNRDVEAGQVDIIVNVAVGNVVKHLEVIANVPPGGKVESVCGGTASFTFASGALLKQFKMTSLTGDPPSFHSNKTSVAMGIYGSPAVNFGGGSITARGTIINGSPPNFISNPAVEKTIPEIDISELPDDLTPSILPPGTYVCKGTGVDFYDILGNPPIFYANNTEIVPGVKVIGGGTELELTKNVEVIDGTGDITLKSVGLKFDKTVKPYLYTGGSSGNLILEGGGLTGYTGDIKGEGRIYALGDVKFNPDADPDALADIKCGDGGNISLYTGGDIVANVWCYMSWAGVIYTKGDFKVKTCSTTLGTGTFSFSEGALIAKENVEIDVSSGNTVLSSISFEMDDTGFSSGPGGAIQTVFWQDF